MRDFKDVVTEGVVVLFIVSPCCVGAIPRSTEALVAAKLARALLCLTISNFLPSLTPFAVSNGHAPAPPATARMHRGEL